MSRTQPRAVIATRLANYGTRFASELHCELASCKDTSNLLHPQNSRKARGLRGFGPKSRFSDTAPQAIAPQKFEAPLEPPQTHSKKLANKFSKFTMAKSAITRAPPADEEAEAFLIKPKQSKSSNIKGILAVAAVAFALYNFFGSRSALWLALG